jgi:hypothetical protein
VAAPARAVAVRNTHPRQIGRAACRDAGAHQFCPAKHAVSADCRWYAPSFLARNVPKTWRTGAAGTEPHNGFERPLDSVAATESRVSCSRSFSNEVAFGGTHNLRGLDVHCLAQMYQLPTLTHGSPEEEVDANFRFWAGHRSFLSMNSHVV